jgi:hypothetical protein
VNPIPRALWLLMRLRLIGWFRRIGVRMSTPKGALLTIFSALILVSWCGSMVVGAVFAPQSADPETLARTERIGPFGMLGYCVLILLSSGGNPAVNFSLAEVQFLFSAPFTRRQLLAYKLMSQFLLTLPFTLFTTFALRTVAGGFLPAFVGAVLIFVFLQLFAMTMSFLGSVLGQLAYSRTRKVLLGVLLVVVFVGVVEALRREGAGDMMKALRGIEDAWPVQVALAPFRWFMKVLTARTLADTLRYVALAAGVDVILLVTVFLLDASYLEASAIASEKRYERLQRIRSGGVAGAGYGTAKPRFTIPNLPWLGGAGPIAWRQLVAASRGYRAFTFLLIFVLVSGIGPAIAYFSEGRADTSVPWSISAVALVMSLIMNQFFAFDFRSDVDRIDVLKTLPIPAWRITLGQLITPALFTSLFQIALIGAIYAAFGQIGYLFLAVVLLAWPVNLLSTCVDNFLFLLFPTRTTQTNPGDLSQAGRGFLLMMARFAALGIGLGVPALVGAMIYFASGHSWIVAGPVAWLLCVILSFTPVPLVAWAFKHFDVASDMPA